MEAPGSPWLAFLGQAYVLDEVVRDIKDLNAFQRREVLGEVLQSVTVQGELLQ